MPLLYYLFYFDITSTFKSDRNHVSGIGLRPVLKKKKLLPDRTKITKIPPILSINILYEVRSSAKKKFMGEVTEFMQWHIQDFLKRGPFSNIVNLILVLNFRL